MTPNFNNMTPDAIAERLQDHFDDIIMEPEDREEINDLMDDLREQMAQVSMLADEEEYLREL